MLIFQKFQENKKYEVTSFDWNILDFIFTCLRKKKKKSTKWNSSVKKIDLRGFHVHEATLWDLRNEGLIRIWAKWEKSRNSAFVTEHIFLSSRTVERTNIMQDTSQPILNLSAACVCPSEIDSVSFLKRKTLHCGIWIFIKISRDYKEAIRRVILSVKTMYSLVKLSILLVSELRISKISEVLK